MKIFPSVALATLALAFVPVLQAQDPTPPSARTGRVVGRVLEDGNGSPVPGAQVGIAAGGQSVTAGVDGRYTLLNVAAGPTALVVRAIGYAPKTVSGVEVPPGGVVSKDVYLAAQTMQVAEISVSAAIERGSRAQALDEQRNANGVVNSVTAEQIARSPDGDAAQAVQRVSGVTVQDGRYVIVRGLGERYTTTSLNGARIPSPETDRKVVPLDLFPSNLLEAVTTSKTFTPDQSGDFSGASVNLRTREFDQGRVLSWSASASFNSASTGRSLPTAPNTGGEWLGLVNRQRRLPGALAAIPDGSSFPASQMPVLVGSFRDVWNAGSGTAGPGGSMAVSVGGEDPVLGHLIGYLGSVTYNSGTDIRRNEERALAVSDGQGGARPQDAYRGQSVTSSVLWGAIANFTTRFGGSTKLSFNNTYNRSADNSAIRLAGTSEEFGTLDLTRLQYVTRSIRSNQVVGEHLIAQRHGIQWMLTSSGVTRDEPDRSDLAYDAGIDSVTGVVTPSRWSSSPQAANRTFTGVKESAWQADASWRWGFGGPAGAAVKAGAQYRTTARDAQTRSYDLFNQSIPDSLLSLPAEQLFTRTGELFLSPSILGGSYDASDRLVAGFGMLELPVSRRLRVIAGARVEHSTVRVTTVATNGQATPSRPVTTDVLPSVAVAADLGGNQQLRLAASQTLSRPEYRELSSVCYFELGGLTSCGEPTLKRALIQNFDARWEWYPRGGEVLSVGVFAKHFSHPIERILVATTGANRIGFVNTNSALNYGVELEMQKNLGALAPVLMPFNVGVNATLMRSRIDIGNGGLQSLTNSTRPMVGQSPYVFNFSLGYVSNAGRFNATVLYNVSGRRISEAGVEPIPDSYEEARHVVDASLRYRLSEQVGVKLDARNLLDAPYRTTQGSVTRARYTVGRGISMGFSWQP